ncbi:MAG: serine/threonine-protein kinase PknD [Mycobacterium sp.]
MTFGKYRLLSVIGQGGMGTVYKAYDTLIGREVAVKILSTTLGDEPGYRERFRREANSVAQLSAPHIIPVHDTGEIDGRLYLVMPIIDGIDIHALLQRDGPMNPARAVDVIEQLADGLHAAHAIGLVHRDVKPSNALVNERGFVYLIDFGLAQHSAAPKLTATNMITGSWAYMAPERFSAAPADARVDIYALACVLYECLTGATPFPGDSLEQQFGGHRTVDPPQPSRHNAAIPVGLDAVIARGMAKDPRQRYQSALDLATAARRALTTTPVSGPGITQPGTGVRGDQAAAAYPPTRIRRLEPPPAPVAFVPPAPPAPRAEKPAVRASAPLQRQEGGERRKLTVPLIVGTVVFLTVAGITGYLLRPQAAAPQIATAPAILSPGQTAPPGQPAPSGQTASTAPAAAGGALPFSGLNRPGGVAVDRAGNVYVADAGNSRVLELAAGASGPTVLSFTGLSNPTGVAVDAARTVYVISNNEVLKLPAGASSTVELPVSLNGPHGLAVDSAGNLYIAAGNSVLKLPAGSSATIELPFTGLSDPSGVAVDGAGAVYVADSGNNRVLKLAGGAIQNPPFTGLNKPDGVAVDSAGAVYVADSGNNRVLKLAAGSSRPTVVPSAGLSGPSGVAVDASGNVYVADTGGNRVVKLSAG